MCKNTYILRFHYAPRMLRKILGKGSIAKLKKTQRQTYKSIPEIVATFFFFTMLSVTVDLRGSSPQINLLQEFRPIGGSGNNLQNRYFDAVPGSPEFALAPLNFAPGTGDGLVDGPNPRIISNVIAGGTGVNGQNGQTTDPVASAWLYVFGQFVDHDLDLEETPSTSASINTPIPQGDPVFEQGTSIAMTRDTRSPKTNTIINTVTG